MQHDVHFGVVARLGEVAMDVIANEDDAQQQQLVVVVVFDVVPSPSTMRKVQYYSKRI